MQYVAKRREILWFDLMCCWTTTYLELFGILFKVLLGHFRHCIIILFISRVRIFFRLLGRLLNHKFLHDRDFLLQFAFLLVHEPLNLINHFDITLRELQDIGDIELVDDRATLFSLFLFELAGI